MAFLPDQQQQQHHELHFVLVPFMAPGHFIPMLDIAILLAQRGLTVTVITTPQIASRFTPKVDRAVQSGHRITLLTLKFPAVESGLPEGSETMESAPNYESMGKFISGYQRIQEPFKEIFRGLIPRPSCLISDKHILWLAEVACEFDTIRIVFDGMSCFTMVVAHCLRSMYETLPESDSEPFVVPHGLLPHSIKLNRTHVPMWCNPMDYYTKRFVDSEREAYGVVVNSFQEMESEYVEEYRKLKAGGKIWCIGPLSISSKDSLDKAQRGNKSVIDDNQCLKWLDLHQPGSVVYACLGSLARLALPQLKELGLGLEASNQPFIWVMRTGKQDQEIDEWMKNEGFEERTKGRGLIIRGWAPQVLILPHPSIGAFITHCGWNSTMEGVSAGVPMITWPMFSEQFFTEKFLVNVAKTAVSVGAQFAVEVYEEDKFGVSVKREAFAEAVEKVMAGGLEGEERRRRAVWLGEMANKATKEGGSSYLNLTSLIDDVMKELSRKESIKEESLVHRSSY